MSVSIAIVGSGPAGCFAADALLRRLPGARIDVIDRLPTPFGLVRGGIAPDHQGSKAIARQFERTLTRPGVRFLGAVSVGRQVAYDELKDLYDIVVLAIGAAEDRRLGIPGEHLDGAYGSAAFVGWYNGHPDYADLDPRLDGPGVAVVGNGNVALDIARVLAKTGSEMAESDIAARAEAAIAAAPLRDLWIIGRRGPAEAAFSPTELGELGHLARCRVVVEGAEIPEAADHPDPSRAAELARNLEILRGYAAGGGDDAPLTLHLLFNASPVAVLGGERVEGLRLARTRVEGGRAVPTGETLDVPVATLVTAIGHRSVPFPGLPVDEAAGVIANADGLVEAGVWATGWCRRGPTGTVAANRQDALDVAGRAAEAFAGPSGKAGPDGLDRLLAQRAVVAVSFEDWRRIESAEVAAARPGRRREKITSIVGLRQAAG